MQHICAILCIQRIGKVAVPFCGIYPCALVVFVRQYDSGCVIRVVAHVFQVPCIFDIPSFGDGLGLNIEPECKQSIVKRGSVINILGVERQYGVVYAHRA